MDIYFKGIDPGPLGSARDYVLREHLSRMRNLETKSLMTQIVSSLGNVEAAKSNFKQFAETTWGVVEDIRVHRQEMMDYYMNHVRHLRPKMKPVGDIPSGEFYAQVTGLRELED